MDKTLELTVTNSLVLKKVQKNKLKCGAKLTAKGWWRFDQMVNIQALSFNVDAQLIPSYFEKDLMSSKEISMDRRWKPWNKCKNKMFVPLSFLVLSTFVAALSNEQREENEQIVLERSLIASFFGLAIKT